MASVTVSGPNLQSMIDQIMNAPNVILAEMEEAARVVTEDLYKAESEYPQNPGNLHLGGPLAGGFYTNKQRRFVLKGLRDGTITVPYPRTMKYKASWNYGVKRLATKIQGTVQINNPLSGVLQGDPQAHLFQGYWQQAMQTWDKQVPEIERKLIAACVIAAGIAFR